MATCDIYEGDCRDVLQMLPDASVDSCVTSPPYFGLRDYGHDTQIGQEETPNGYVAELVGVFSEVQRVLKDEGTFWLNLGDSYAAGKTGRSDKLENPEFFNKTGSQEGWTPDQCRQRKAPDGFRDKDLLGIPWRVAFALQQAGWFLRQDIIWAKPNPMPESVKDRCTRAHEYIFLLTKRARYYFDSEAIQEPATKPGYPVRTKRDVWTVALRPYRAAHFATFPPDLITPAILAGCPPGGVVLDPFAGSGTVGQVAHDLDRRAILIEANPDYAQHIRKRLNRARNPLFESAGIEEPIHETKEPGK